MTKSVCYTDVFIILTFFVLLNVVYQYEGEKSVDGKADTSKTTTVSQSEQPANTKTPPVSKWIVVTTIQYPTEDIKNLASQPGWNVVIVADTKTPPDWSYPGVHFLSVDKQKELFGDFAEKMPYKSYTRKNLGYLYAIMKGAEWIYDTDDDNKPYGLGLSQFDYEFYSPISGLRYISKSGNISEKLFNPYRFYGYDNIWPRGFPLEYIAGHSNGKDRMVSCRQMNRPAVQQGIVKIDPDVDAIYRLLHAQKGSGLNVSFNNIAPSIILDSGTYSPWNSQNTLFHYKAFFIMYLPTTVTFRVTDIWRSYFGQKLLHLIGENVAFYPTNAVQIRNAHDYLSDFHQEINVYEQSGKIVEFLDKWNCSHNDVVSCTLELADEFVENNFFGKEDRNLIEMWLKQLTNLGYKYPALVEHKPIVLGQKYGNCKRANLDFGVDKYQTNSVSWAVETINGFGEILKWCEDVNGTEVSGTFLPTGREFVEMYRNITGLQNKRDTVLVMTSNPPWVRSIVGLIQRLYSPFFKSTIFCGTWTDPMTDPGLLPPIEPLNFVDLTQEEIRGGSNYGYCLSKVRDLRLQNVTGYYFVADDSVFNVWYDLPQDKYLNPWETDPGPYWWRPEEITRSYDVFESHYKNDPRFGKSWREYKEILQEAYPGKNITEHYLTAVRSYYVPTHKMEYLGNLMEVMSEAEVFVEIAFGKMTDGLDFNLGGNFTYLWHGARLDQWTPYNSFIMGLHPIKLAGIHDNLDYRKKYCTTVVKAFGGEIYGRKTKKYDLPFVRG